MKFDLHILFNQVHIDKWIDQNVTKKKKKELWTL